MLKAVKAMLEEQKAQQQRDKAAGTGTKVQARFPAELWSPLVSHGGGLRPLDRDRALLQAANGFTEALAAVGDTISSPPAGLTALVMPASDRNVASLRAWATHRLLLQQGRGQLQNGGGSGSLMPVSVHPISLLYCPPPPPPLPASYHMHPTLHALQSAGDAPGAVRPPLPAAFVWLTIVAFESGSFEPDTLLASLASAIAAGQSWTLVVSGGTAAQAAASSKSLAAALTALLKKAPHTAAPGALQSISGGSTGGVVVWLADTAADAPVLEHSLKVALTASKVPAVASGAADPGAVAESRLAAAAALTEGSAQLPSSKLPSSARGAEEAALIAALASLLGACTGLDTACADPPALGKETADVADLAASCVQALAEAAAPPATAAKAATAAFAAWVSALLPPAQALHAAVHALLSHSGGTAAAPTAGSASGTGSLKSVALAAEKLRAAVVASRGSGGGAASEGGLSSWLPHLRSDCDGLRATHDSKVWVGAKVEHVAGAVDHVAGAVGQVAGALEQQGAMVCGIAGLLLPNLSALVRMFSLPHFFFAERKCS
jgi:hypothetical protein